MRARSIHYMVLIRLKHMLLPSNEYKCIYSDHASVSKNEQQKLFACRLNIHAICL